MLNNLAPWYCLIEVYRWGLIVALIIATAFLPFVVTVYAITGEINARKQVLQQSWTFYFYFSSFRFRTEHSERRTGKKWSSLNKMAVIHHDSIFLCRYWAPLWSLGALRLTCTLLCTDTILLSKPAVLLGIWRWSVLNKYKKACGLILILFFKGQYTKVPPRVTFVVQSTGAVVVCDSKFFSLRIY